MNSSMHRSCSNLALLVCPFPQLCCLEWPAKNQKSLKIVGRTWGFCWKGWIKISTFLLPSASTPSSQVLYSSSEVILRISTFQIIQEYLLLVRILLHQQHRHSLLALQDFRSASLQHLQWGKRPYQNFPWASGNVSGQCSASTAVKSGGVQMNLGVWN